MFRFGSWFFWPCCLCKSKPLFSLFCLHITSNDDTCIGRWHLVHVLGYVIHVLGDDILFQSNKNYAGKQSRVECVSLCKVRVFCKMERKLYLVLGSCFWSWATSCCLLGKRESEIISPGTDPRNGSKAKRKWKISLRAYDCTSTVLDHSTVLCDGYWWKANRLASMLCLKKWESFRRPGCFHANKQSNTDCFAPFFFFFLFFETGFSCSGSLNVTVTGLSTHNKLKASN